MLLALVWRSLVIWLIATTLGSIVGRMLPATVLAFDTNRDGDLEIYLLDVNHDIALNLTRNRADDTMPVWSPDSRWIVFASYRAGNEELFMIDRDGGNVRQLTNHPAEDR